MKTSHGIILAVIAVLVGLIIGAKNPSLASTVTFGMVKTG